MTRIRIVRIALGTVIGSMILLNSAQSQISKWTDRAVELGITSAHVVIEYSLTDDCNLAPIRIVENSSEVIFDAATIAEVIGELVGPFEFVNRRLLRPELEPSEEGAKLSMSGRKFRWDTDLGHSYIACRFYATGALADAVYIDGRIAVHQTVENRPVARKLSNLGTRTQTVRIEIDEGPSNDALH